MIIGGNATVYVSDMDRAVEFYVERLGLKLRRRFGNHWAEVEAGQSLVIGLHPQSANGPAPGTSGSISIGLAVDEPIEQLVQRLGSNGVKFRGPVVKDSQAAISFAFFSDPDGNDLYFAQPAGSW